MSFRKLGDPLFSAGIARQNALGARMTGKLQYWQKAITLLGQSSIIAYYPLWEPSGTTCTDIVNGYNGAYASGISLANITGPNRKPVPLFASKDVNIYSAAAANAWNGATGSLIQWFKPSSVNVWTDSAYRQFCYIRYDANNICSHYKMNSNNVVVSRFCAGGTNRQVSINMGGTNWQLLITTWSGSAVNAYLNGTLYYNQAASGAWAAAPVSSYMRIGSLDGGQQFWDGWIADTLICNRAISPAEVRALASYSPVGVKFFAFLGDSITAFTGTVNWTDYLTQQYSVTAGMLNHAASGATIASDLAGQVTAAASDNADKIIIHMGTNDNNAGNMTTLQATVEAQIAALKASNPRATIYYMNVLPKWTDNTGATPVDRSNVRTAIAAACTAQGITCWDTFTTPWIAANQTLDGTHPTAAGYSAIAAQALARQ